MDVAGAKVMVDAEVAVDGEVMVAVVGDAVTITAVAGQVVAMDAVSKSAVDLVFITAGESIVAVPAVKTGEYPHISESLLYPSSLPKVTPFQQQSIPQEGDISRTNSLNITSLFSVFLVLCQQQLIPPASSSLLLIYVSSPILDDSLLLLSD
ncbi:hypothetical protein Aperf_G00000008828 [Anoplocephala perfoliata]